MTKKAALVLLVLVSACSPGLEPAHSDGTWVGTITTEGNLTTVVNESGSVWGGTARLVEELSIGVEAGEDPHMFGRIPAIWATDGAIYVVDGQVGDVRVFDHEGRWLGRIGRPGQGPGEFLRPDSVMADAEGRIFVGDSYAARMNIYSKEGEPLATWSLASLRSFGAAAVTPDGRLLLRVTHPGTNRAIHEDDTVGIQIVDDGGAAAGPPWDSEVSPARSSFFEGTSVSRPFAPAHRTALVPAGGIVAGFSDRYAIEIRWLDGRVTRILREVELVPVQAELREYRRANAVATVRAQIPDWSWDGADMPGHKPAFRDFFPDASDRILVLREGPSRPIEGCQSDPTDRNEPFERCWQTEWLWDVFTIEGRYLGDVVSPVGWVSTMFVRDDMWLLVVQDEAGTIMVKRYRLVLPGEE